MTFVHRLCHGQRHARSLCFTSSRRARAVDIGTYRATRWALGETRRTPHHLLWVARAHLAWQLSCLQVICALCVDQRRPAGPLGARGGDNACLRINKRSLKKHARTCSGPCTTANRRALAFYVGSRLNERYWVHVRQPECARGSPKACQRPARTGAPPTGNSTPRRFAPSAPCPGG